MRNVIRLFLAVSLSVYFVSCNSPKPPLTVTIVKRYNPVAIDTVKNMVKIGDKDKVWVRMDELIVLKPDDYSKEDVLNAFKNAFISIPKLSGIKIKKYCNECEDKVILLEGNDLQNYLVRMAPGGGDACPNTSNCNSSQQEITQNAIPQDSIRVTTRIDYKPTIDFPKSANQITLAILDTGIDPLDNYFVGRTNKFFTDLQGIVKGIDVTNDNVSIEDMAGVNMNGYPTDGIHHGTKVIKIILSQLPSNSNVKILPIKITNSCPGNLYDALCGLYTAQKYGADIINASWNYQANDDIYRLTRKVFRFLEGKNVTIVAAAGNDSLNLDTNKLYPACFKDSCSNIYSVTSVQKKIGGFVVVENYSDKFVDLGVSTYSNDVFKVPKTNNTPITSDDYELCYGTSFATAYITGYLCREGLVHSPKNEVIGKIIFKNIPVSGIPDKVYIPE
ncbi:MAG: S8 family serine peptidase [Arcicella sp.]|nr:S8 family serine peptidase [Arcicella sp.]